MAEGTSQLAAQKFVLDFKDKSHWAELRRILYNLVWTRKSAGVGTLIVLVFVILAIWAPVLAPYDPAAQDLTNRYVPPSREYWLGTDNFGRDVLSRIIWGGRISLVVGVVSVAISLVFGALIGLTAGYTGGVVDQTLSSVVDVLMAFPLLLLALAMITVLGPGMLNLMLAIGLASVPIFARVLRAETQSARGRDYVTAAYAVGAQPVRVVMRHIFPNIGSSVIVLVTTRIAAAILIESSLSFLGIGIQPPTASWGVMVSEGRNFLERAPWIALAPGVAIMIVVLGFNLFGDGLRDALDVRLRHTRQ
jgi:peptide/nickel transport system permease protein